MTKYFTNNFPEISLYKKPSVKSEIVTQMIYGDSFSISRKTKKWLKIKIFEDNYIGYIKNKKYSNFLKPTHKVNALKAKVYRLPNKNKKNEITFGSKIKVIDSRAKFLKFANGWIKKTNLKPISYKEKDPFKKITSFKNIRYKWGGKSFKGIDCSALVQVFLNFNNKFCPRDAKDQVNFGTDLGFIEESKEGDLAFFDNDDGEIIHVGILLKNNYIIHASGYVKIDRIDQTGIYDLNKKKHTHKLRTIKNIIDNN